MKASEGCFNADIPHSALGDNTNISLVAMLYVALIRIVVEKKEEGLSLAEV